MKKYNLVIIYVIVILFTSCNRTSLNNDEASRLIRESLKLPHQNSQSVGMGSYEIAPLKNEGYIEVSYDKRDPWNQKMILEITAKGQPYYLGKIDKQYHGADYYFKTSDIDLNDINGISVDNESKTAIVRFTLKVTNTTPIADIMINLINRQAMNDVIFPAKKYYPPQNEMIEGELVFKKFDNGWQLNSEQNNSNNYVIKRLLNEINN